MIETGLIFLAKLWTIKFLKKNVYVMLSPFLSKKSINCVFKIFGNLEG